MIVVSRSIHIRAPIERVFALMADPVARSALSPHARPLAVRMESRGPLRAGSVCHFRLQMNDRILDYRMRVREFVPNQRIVSISDSEVPFELALETTADRDGTRLTQTERFEPTEEMLSQALQQTPSSAAMEKIYQWLPFLDPEYATRVHRGREQMLAQQLEGNMEQWLTAIKQHLEAV